jgi:hypothetical protein
MNCGHRASFPAQLRRAVRPPAERNPPGRAGQRSSLLPAAGCRHARLSVVRAIADVPFAARDTLAARLSSPCGEGCGHA